MAQKLVEHYGTQQKACDVIGLGRGSMSRILRGRSLWSTTHAKVEAHYKKVFKQEEPADLLDKLRKALETKDEKLASEEQVLELIEENKKLVAVIRSLLEQLK